MTAKWLVRGPTRLRFDDYVVNSSKFQNSSLFMRLSRISYASNE